MGDPFRDEENAALMRAARLEEENAKLRKELEEAKHPKPPPPPAEEEPEPTKTEPAGTDRETRSNALIAAVAMFLVLGGVVVVALSGQSRRAREVALAKSLDPSPTLAPVASVQQSPDWVEEKHITEIDIRAVTHGVKPPVNYAVGVGGTILRRYGDVWTVEASGTTSDLHGVAEMLGKVCAVGDGGVATCALDPSKPAWKLEKTGTTADLLALNQTYGLVAVGRKGTIVRRRDDVWEREDSGTKEDLFGVAGGYVVGAHGTILEQSDKGWHKVPSPTTADLYAVESHLHEVVIVGAGGVIVQLGDPRAGFQLVSSGVTTDLYAVAHGSGFETYAAGAGGVVLTTRGGSAPWVPQTIDTQRDLHTIDAWLPTMFIGGDHGTILSRRY